MQAAKTPAPPCPQHGISKRYPRCAQCRQYRTAQAQAAQRIRRREYLLASGKQAQAAQEGLL